jgi:hypothetical protein
MSGFEYRNWRPELEERSEGGYGLFSISEIKPALAGFNHLIQIPKRGSSADLGFAISIRCWYDKLE